ncbi:hypothetical protein BJV74DRAFT_572835 [Russula compacta]|nr:hypothetical protein BJV74DRAFT_572835 [Russula compacta]
MLSVGVPGAAPIVNPRSLRRIERPDQILQRGSALRLHISLLKKLCLPNHPARAELKKQILSPIALCAVIGSHLSKRVARQHEWHSDGRSAPPPTVSTTLDEVKCVAYATHTSGSSVSCRGSMRFIHLTACSACAPICSHRSDVTISLSIEPFGC